MNGARAMVQDISAIAQEAFMEAVKPTRPFSTTRLIGGKLRALYDEDTQPYPDRVIQLLTALDGGFELTGITPCKGRGAGKIGPAGAVARTISYENNPIGFRQKITSELSGSRSSELPRTVRHWRRPQGHPLVTSFDQVIHCCHKILSQLLNALKTLPKAMGQGVDGHRTRAH